MGTMQEVRELLGSGASSAQVIGQGYAPGTVYKVQRELRKGPRDTAVVLAQPSQPVTGEAREKDGRIRELEEKVRTLEDLLDTVAGDVLLTAELDGEQLTEVVDNLHAVQAQRDEGVRQVTELQSLLETARQEATMAQDQARGWRARWHADKAAHSFAARQTADKLHDLARLQAEGEQLRAERDAVQATLQEVLEVARNMYADYQALLPLQAAWDGHPCTKCGKPMGGVVDRALAAKLMQGLAHSSCLDNDPPGWVIPAAIGGAILYGLSRQQGR